ncbi:DEAD/DEAH box helicase family protein [Lysinibacillus capsici]|uniref:DEAD/DEAH box helicase family protein n=1 Tax=Lysinibacillus capsici TaxID=2115968 RepID=UPI002E1C4F67|nr:DEAD/DEAH box helicase family protein [Lysinibacillus capsici]
MNVTELIQQDYLEWQRGDIITISAGTGKGKSHFVKNTLYDYAKEKGKQILFFLHRTSTLEQFEAEVAAEGKSDVIDLITYQSFEKAIIRQNQLDLWMYEFIICDEYHYFGNDSFFNPLIKNCSSSKNSKVLSSKRWFFKSCSRFSSSTYL